MPYDAGTGNGTGSGTIAPLANVALFDELLHRVVSRPRHLPGIAVFYGFSGYGKTFSATYGAQRRRAFYLEVGESWTKKHFLKMLLVELGLPPARTAPEMVTQAIEQLAMIQRPLIIDEFDHVVARGYHETVREIHDKSGVPIALLGEELLPTKVAQRSERLHNRVLDWVPAQPAGAQDAAALARLYCRGVELRGDLLERIAAQSDGRVRRICVNLERVRETASIEGLASIGLAEWGERPLWRGEPPAVRR